MALPRSILTPMSLSISFLHNKLISLLALYGFGAIPSTFRVSTISSLFRLSSLVTFNLWLVALVEANQSLQTTTSILFTSSQDHIIYWTNPNYTNYWHEIPHCLNLQKTNKNKVETMSSWSIKEHRGYGDFMQLKYAFFQVKLSQKSHEFIYGSSNHKA